MIAFGFNRLDETKFEDGLIKFRIKHLFQPFEDEPLGLEVSGSDNRTSSYIFPSTYIAAEIVTTNPSICVIRGLGNNNSPPHNLNDF